MSLQPFEDALSLAVSLEWWEDGLLPAILGFRQLGELPSDGRGVGPDFFEMRPRGGYDRLRLMPEDLRAGDAQ
jgi:hypothetical protein